MLRLAAALSLPSAPLTAAAAPRRRVAARADSPTQLAAVVLQLRQHPAAARARKKPRAQEAARKKPRLPATPTQQEGADANADANADADASPKPRRACVRCGVQKTPQWRAGPDGPKTLCNACGVAEVKRSAAQAPRTTQVPQPAAAAS